MLVVEYFSWLKNFLQLNVFSVASRVIAAIVGGYLLANCLAILLSYLLPISKAEGVLIGLLISFVIYACSVIWVFAARTTWNAWLGLLIPGGISAIALYYLIPEGLL